MKQTHDARSRMIAASVCVAMLAAFAALAWSASMKKCATYDEPLHLVSAWLAVHEGDFRCDPEDPSLWKYYAAAGTAWPQGKIDLKSPAAMEMLDHPTKEYAFSWDAFNTTSHDPIELLRPARARMLFIAVLLGALIAWWGWRMGGAVTAVAGAAFFCFDPNFMAHAPLMKNDVAFSLVILALSFTLWRLGQRISWFWFGALGVVMAMGMNIKFSAVLLVPITFVLLLARAMMPIPWPALGRELISRWQRLAAAALIALGVMLIAWVGIWLCYDGRFLPTRDASLAFDLHPDVQLATMAEFLVEQHVVTTPSASDWEKWGKFRPPSATVASILWLNEHRILPQSWLVGFLFTYANSRARPSFLWGEYSRLGWWYYFPLAMIFKTSLATMAALLGGVMVAIIHRRRKKSAGGREDSQSRWPALWTTACLVVPPGIYLFSVMHSHLNLGLRHVLPVYPFLFIGVGLAAGAAWEFRPRVAAVLGVLLAVGLLTENLCAFPDYIAFFNVAVGGERGGIRLLSDSNLDWGQDLPLLAAWQRQHPDDQLGLCYFGAADPKNYGIHYVNMRGSNAKPDIPALRPGTMVLAISATQLQGTYQSDAERAAYEGLKRQEPIAVLGGTIYLFEIPVH